MSLIQEALRRQQEEENKSGKATGAELPAEEGAPEILPGISAAPPPAPVAAPADPTAPPAPAVPPAPTAPPVQPAADAPPSLVEPPPSDLEVKPTPPPAPGEEPASSKGAMSSRVPSVFLQSDKKKKSAAPKLIGLLIIIALITGGGFYLLKGKKSGDKPASASAAELPTSSEDLLEIEPVTDTLPVESQPAQPVQPTEVQPSDGTPTPVTPAPTVSSPSILEPKARVMWPSLTLSGVMGKGKKGSAIINGEFLGVGDSIEGVKILSVQEKGVRLSYQGEVQALSVGNTTM